MMLRSFASAVQGLGVIIGITAGIPWLLMPHGADWAALGFGLVLVVAAALVLVGHLLLRVTLMGPAPRRAGAASQVAVVVPRKPRRRVR